MNEFRLILDPPMSAPVNMARDHAILKMQTKRGSVPTLRIYSWSSPSVTLGYFQRCDNTVDLEYCRRNGITVTRRITGGGTVLHHRELTYSFTVPVIKRIVPESVDESFRSIISPIIESLRSMSINAEYRPVNDIVINARKISGSAQVRRSGILQQHGTLIMDLDSALINRALINNTVKLESRGFKNTSEAVTSVSSEMNVHADENLSDEIISRIISSYSRAMNIDFALADLNEIENAAMNSYINRFSSDEWNFKREYHGSDR